MRLRDVGAMAGLAITGHPLRSLMLLIAVAIGVAAVLVLTSLGEGARRYVTGEFNALGTSLLFVVPGRNSVGGVGGMAGAFGGSPRPLTLQDALALQRSPHVVSVTAMVPGTGRISHDGLEREVTLLGTTHNMQRLFGYSIGSGRFLPELELDDATPIGVIGHTIARELFANKNPVGEVVRFGDRRVRIIGVMAQSGQTGGFDLDEVLFVPVGFAIQAFDRDSVNRLIVEVRAPEVLATAKTDVERIMRARHQGKDDVTVVDPGAILDTFNIVFAVLSATLAGIASISLIVAGTLIMNVMLVAVSQRTAEIGLMKALGARRRQIVGLFLTEAFILSALGAAAGVFFGQLMIGVLREIYPIVDFQAPGWAAGAAVIIALASGLVFGILPARRAANLDPVAALAGR